MLFLKKIIPKENNNNFKQKYFWQFIKFDGAKTTLILI